MIKNSGRLYKEMFLDMEPKRAIKNCIFETAQQLNRVTGVLSKFGTYISQFGRRNSLLESQAIPETAKNPWETNGV